MKKMTLLLVALGVASFSQLASAMNCNAVISNQSNLPWTFKFDTVRGNVYFPGGNCSKNGPCDIPAHTTVNIEYTYTTKAAVGDVRIQDYQGKAKRYAYYAKQDECPRIERAHQDESVHINDPFQGNYLIVGDTW